MKNPVNVKSKILIIRFRRVGDAVISSVLCSSLKKSFPNAEIHYILNENIAPLFENHPDIDKIITFSDEDQKSFFQYISKVWKIVSDNQYDIIVDTRSTIKTLWFSLFSLRTPSRIGRKKAYNQFIQNHRVALGHEDEVSNTLKLLKPLYHKYKIEMIRHFNLYTTLEEKQAFRRKMEATGLDLSRPIIVCAVTARLEHKVWEKEKMVEILRRMLDKFPDIQLIFNYAGEREKSNSFDIFHALNQNPRIFINLEAHNLRELLALYSFSSFFFGNEGGPRHISQAMNVPGLAIFPPSIPKSVWLPNSCERFQGIELADINPLAAKEEALSFEEKFQQIDTESVWNQLEPMLEKFADNR